MSNSKSLGASGGLAGLGAILGGLAQSNPQRQAREMQMAHANQYQNFSDSWISLTNVAATSASTSNSITISGQMLTPDQINYDPARMAVKKKDEFAWLRDRVNEVCWRPAA
jgi:hypothetical protein